MRHSSFNTRGELPRVLCETNAQENDTEVGASTSALQPGKSSHMELIYWGEDSKHLYLREQTDAYMARFPNANLVVRRLVREDELTADEHLLCLISDQQCTSSAQVLVVIHDDVVNHDDGQQIPVNDSSWHLFVGQNDETNFAQLMRHVALQAERMRLHQLISAPIVHDLRGALGIVALSAEILKSHSGLDKIVQKLLSARTKAEALVSDLQVASSPDFLNPLPTQRKVREQHHSRSLHEILQETAIWFSAAHREHQFAVGPLEPAATAARYSGLIVRGIVDTLARLSPEPSEICVLASNNGQLQITLAAQLTIESRQALDRLGSTYLAPSTHSEAAAPLAEESRDVLPFRWWLSLHAVRADDGKLSVSSNDKHLTVIYDY